MFCPECQCEYRAGFTHCADCDVDLVESLDGADSDPDSPDGAGLGEGLREVWKGESQEQCGLLADQLRAAGIPFETRQTKDNLFQGLGQSYRIVVPDDVGDHAAALITQWVAELEYQSGEPVELPAEDDEPDDSAPARRRGPWHPEDATVEISSGEAPEIDEMIEVSLRENQIRTRVDADEEGARSIYVLPEDEPRAREIIREIKDATPRG